LGTEKYEVGELVEVGSGSSPRPCATAELSVRRVLDAAVSIGDFAYLALRLAAETGARRAS
jgi:hypothetical protein